RAAILMRLSDRSATPRSGAGRLSRQSSVLVERTCARGDDAARHELAIGHGHAEDAESTDNGSDVECPNGHEKLWRWLHLTHPAAFHFDLDQDFLRFARVASRVGGR